jgi:hypothetical protein
MNMNRAYGTFMEVGAVINPGMNSGATIFTVPNGT